MRTGRGRWLGRAAALAGFEATSLRAAHHSQDKGTNDEHSPDCPTDDDEKRNCSLGRDESRQQGGQK